MHLAFSIYFQDIPLTGDTRGDMIAVLRSHGCEQTIAHSLQVAGEARRLAQRFGAQPEQAEIAGWLHDISAIVLPAERLGLAERLQLEILPEERTAPMLIHQKLSEIIARGAFGIRQSETLSAIGCHTTLKANAGLLDKVLFVADKIQRDQPGEPPYLAELLMRLESSLDAAALCYLEHLYHRRTQLPALHPWALQAYLELGGAP
jgi:predicted HD superfamily hydrolase involved in NAD metabolism